MWVYISISTIYIRARVLLVLHRDRWRIIPSIHRDSLSKPTSSGIDYGNLGKIYSRDKKRCIIQKHVSRLIENVTRMSSADFA